MTAPNRMRGMRALGIGAAVGIGALFVVFFESRAASGGDQTIELRLWHSYSGNEREALTQAIDAFHIVTPSIRVRASAVPFDAFPDKLTAAIPRGHGPDVFIFAHDRVGGWAEGGLIEPLELLVDERLLDLHVTPCVFSLAYGESLYGLPLAFKPLLLYLRSDRVEGTPKTFEELIEIAKKNTDRSKGRYGLVYSNADLFFHSPLLFSLGGTLFSTRDGESRVDVENQGVIRSLALARRIAKDEAVIPDDPNPVVGSAMFSDGRAAMVASGPWFRGEIDRSVKYHVAPLPAFLDGVRSSGFSTCEGILMSKKTAHRREAFELMRFLSTDLRAAKPRMLTGRQPVTLVEAWEKLLPELSSEEQAVFVAFKDAFDVSVTSPSEPKMAAVWTPMNAALYKTIHQGMRPEDAAHEAQERIRESLEPSGRR